MSIRRFGLAVVVVTLMAAGLWAPPAAAALVTDPASLVNPMVGTREVPGTGNGGNTFPGPSMPFGMVQWGPDTSPRYPGGAYNHDATAISGFGLNRMSGAGCYAYGDLPFLPVTGTPPADKNAATVGFTHAGESARLGYYSLTTSNGVRTELTTATRSALGKFTFPAGTAATLLLKAAGGAAVSRTSISAVGTTEVTGWTSGGAFCATQSNYTMYFAVKFDRAFSTAQKWGPPAMVTGDGGIALGFPAGSIVKAKVGVSFVSAQNAQANRDTLASWDLPTVEQAARSAWNGLLGRVQIGGGTLDQQKIFYTALYHTLLNPNLFSDANRQYRGFDGVVRTVPTGQGAQYANFSGWDIYRTQIQLLALLAPNETSDIIRSMLNDHAESGRLPKWTMANTETYVMVGDPAIPIIASAYAFGARNFDTSRALAAMVGQSTVPGRARPGTVYLDTLGYLPDDGGYGCCNHYGTTGTSLEYHVADSALASFAQALGDEATHARFAERAQGWQYLLHPSSGFVQPRLASGQWRANFDPTGFSQSDWAEGDSWKYTPMVPFNARGLIDAKGGPGAMTQYLDTHFEQLNQILGPHAWMGNEPSFGTPWLYSHAGAPYKTQQVVRRIQTELYRNTPDGLPGNDDLGSLSAWYVWSALGMYPAVPGRADLVLGSPMFPQTVLNLPSGATVTINAPAASSSAPYVQSMSVNGQPWTKAHLPLSTITSGATIDVTLGTTANVSWAATPDAAPPSYGTNAVAVANNTGTSNDSSPGQANYDQWVSSYSAQALAAAGVAPGSRLVRDGVTYTWPNVRPGLPDNVIAAGQRLTVAGPPGATRIGVLGSAEGDMAGAAGTATIHYSNGTSQQVTLGFSDWTLAGGLSSIRPDNTVAVSTPYRNQGLSGGSEQVQTYVYAASFPLDPARTVVGLTLPATVTGGRLHVFTVGFGGHRDSAGISDDTYLGGADFDLAASSYSRQALTAAGLAPGAAITHNGVRYTWPNTPAGARDNMIASGQRIPVTPIAAATKVGVLGASALWPWGVSGTATISYTDGTAQQVTLGFTDWTRAAGSEPVSFGNTVVAQLPYRNRANGRENVTTYVFAATFPLSPGKTVQAITLPGPSAFGSMHVFAVGTG